MQHTSGVCIQIPSFICISLKFENSSNSDIFANSFLPPSLLSFLDLKFEKMFSSLQYIHKRI